MQTLKSQPDQIHASAQALFFAGKVDAALALLRENEALTIDHHFPTADRNRLLILHSEILIVRTWLKPHTPIDRAEIMLASALEHATEEDQRAATLMATGRLHYFPMFQAEAPDANLPLDFFTQALDTWRQSENTRGICEANFWIGLIFQLFLPDLEKAERHFRTALELATAHGFKLEHSYAVRHLGFIAQKRGELDTARALLEQSLSLREEIGFIVYVPFSLLSLASVCIAQGDLTAAQAYYLRALSTAEALDFELVIVRTLLELGEFHKQRGRSEDARKLWKRARDLSTRCDFAAGVQQAEQALVAFSSKLYSKAE